MKSGLFPGQQEALARRAAELRRQAARPPRQSALLGLGLGVLIGLLLGSGVTLAVSHPDAVPGRDGLPREPSEPRAPVSPAAPAPEEAPPTTRAPAGR